MNGFMSEFQRLAVWVLPVLFAITLHEVAHGWTAEKLGDKTARQLGRIPSARYWCRCCCSSAAA